jgi:hypothetical protein
MRFRGLLSTFPSVLRLCARCRLFAVLCAVSFALNAAAAGPKSGPALHVEVTVVPTVQTIITAPTLAAPSGVTASGSVTSVASDSTKVIGIEWRLLPQNVSSATNQAQISGVAQENHLAVLETFTVVSP